MSKMSAGVLMYRRRGGGVEVLLVHPGGPYWKNKDAGAWTIPKGEPAADEELLEAAKREFEEETGIAPSGEFTPLPGVKQKGGKVIHAWAIESDLDLSRIHSNTFEMEWPPRSGRRQAFPEVDRAEFFNLDDARAKMNSGQAALLDALKALLVR